MPSTEVASIDLKLLEQLILTLRRSKLSPHERRRLINEFLQAVDVIKIEDQERLVCIKCAMEIRGYKNHSSIYRSGDRHRLHTFTVCCRTFYARAEIEVARKSKGTTGRIKQVKVGIKV